MKEQETEDNKYTSQIQFYSLNYQDVSAIFNDI